MKKSEAKPGPPDEGRLVELLQSGDLRALDELVRRFGPGLHRYLSHLCRDTSEAEDVVHETLLRIFENPKRLDRVRSLSAWIFRVARNIALDRGRQQSRQEGLRRRLSLPQSLSGRPEERLDALEFQDAFENALAFLPEPQRSAFLLREVEDMSYEQIGRILDCGTKTLSTRLHRARMALREQLAPYLEDLGVRDE